MIPRPLRPVLLATLACVATSVTASTQPLAKILLIAGEPSHGPGEHRFPDGCALLAKALNESGLAVWAETKLGWPGDDALAAAKSVVLYSDGLDRHVAAGKAGALRSYFSTGKGLAVLHFALE